MANPMNKANPDVKINLVVSIFSPFAEVTTAISSYLSRLNNIIVTPAMMKNKPNNPKAAS